MNGLLNVMIANDFE